MQLPFLAKAFCCGRVFQHLLDKRKRSIKFQPNRMVGPATDCLRNPLGAVRILFERACESGAALSDLADSDWGVKELFHRCLFEEAALGQVPEINAVHLDSIPSNSLVRFRGMIQDMFNTEYYVGAYKVGSTWHTAKYTDTAQFTGETATEVWDRRIFYVVPVPGENSWVRAALRVKESVRISNSLIERGDKRSRDSLIEDAGPIDMEADPVLGDSTGSKRMREEGAPDAGHTQQAVDLNMPLGEKKLLPCLVKVYDSADADLKLNEVVEFVGVLTFDPQLSAGTFMHNQLPREDAGDIFMEDDLAQQLPASKVPRLHCITFRKLLGHNIFSAVPHHHVGAPSNAVELRRSLLEGLIHMFGGDHLLAEYFLLHMLSQVHTRRDTLCLGKLSLNITGCKGSVQEASVSPSAIVASAIAALLPRSHMIPLTLELLNKSLFFPQKDYQTNRLTTGVLQLSEGTHLTLDETSLQAGQLTDVGLQNMHSLKNLMVLQKVEYDFKYYKMEVPTDVPVLVVSQGKARMLPADAVVPIRAAASFNQLVATADDLSNWRLYLNNVRGLSHTISPSVHKIVEADLVSARQQDRSLGPDDFHRWLTLARLMSLSYGETALSAERWHMVKDVERRLAERVRCC